MRRFPPDSPQEWMRLANDDLAVAGLGTRLVSLEILCFHAQQAAEKALKATLIDRRIDFPHTHDVQELLTALQEAGVHSASDSHEWNRLTRYAVLTRYPGLGDALTVQEYRAALQVAQEIVQWAKEQISGRGGNE